MAALRLNWRYTQPHLEQKHKDCSYLTGVCWNAFHSNAFICVLWIWHLSVHVQKQTNKQTKPIDGLNTRFTLILWLYFVLISIHFIHLSLKLFTIWQNVIKNANKCSDLWLYVMLTEEWQEQSILKLSGQTLATLLLVGQTCNYRLWTMRGQYFPSS